ncbi:MAG: SIP domain-containing protein [Ilumatobacteraceae bacterium]
MSSDERTIFEDQLAANAEQMLAQMSTAYEDSLLFVARILGGVDAPTTARAVAVDALGLELEVDGAGRIRLPFAQPAQQLVDISRLTMALVAQARATSGEPGETSAERQMRQLSSVRTFITSVVAVEDVHPHLRRITFGGGDLTTFAPLGADTFLYVLLPPPGRSELTIDAGFTWEACGQMAEDVRPVGAYYTLREWRPGVCELDVLFVLHDPAGPASAWAARAQPGDPVALWGPREAFTPPPDATRFVLVADETGLPAVAAILDSLDASARVDVVAECDVPEEHQPLPEHPGATVHWVHRLGRPAGTAPELLLDVVRGLDLDPTVGYVWGGGESRAMTAVRKLVRRELGWPRDRVSLVAYWRHADSPAADPEE